MSKESPFFAGIEVVRLSLELPHIPGEWWIEAKKELTIFEQKKYQKAGVPFVQQAQQTELGATPDTKLGLDMGAMAFERVMVYVVDWNLTDKDGKTATFTRQSVQNLRPDIFEAIEAALDKHIAALVQEKKATSGETKPKLAL